MNNTLKLVLVSALVALVVTLGVSTVTSPNKATAPGTQGVAGEVGPVGPQGPQGERGPVVQGVSGLSGLLTSLQNLVSGLADQSSKFGAVTGPTFPNPNCTGGLCTAVVEGVCNDATTTLARIDTPFPGATSTVVSVFLKVTSAASTTAAQGSPVVNLGTTTIGSAPVATAATSSSALLSGVVLPNLATTTVFVHGGVVFTPGLGGRTFEVGPKSTTSPFNSRAVLWLGGSADTLNGWTSVGNIASCIYRVEFRTSDK